MINKRIRTIVLILLTFIMVPVLAQSPEEQSFEFMKNMDIYSSVMRELGTIYVDDVNPGDLTKTGIDAMLESLDPYTNYIPESEIEDYKFITTGQYGGIGALIHKEGDYVIISEPYEGSPAQKSGIMAGDKILEINHQSAVGKSNDDVSTLLKGQAGTPVTLLLLQPGETKPVEKVINREIIKIDNIPWSGMLDDSIGYIRLSGFTQNAAREVKEAYQKIRDNHKIKGMVLDLRGNGGGLLNEAVDIVNIFVDKGQEVVTTKGKTAANNRTHFTMNPPVDTKIPLVVLTDRQSASASEIVAGSIQDLDRGVIVGQRTFGKGLVQNVVPLSYGAQMKITVAKYYIPSGRCIQAIDYFHRNKDGQAGQFPDSLIRAFKTKHGRTVYDGRGITPDFIAPSKEFSNITLSLFSKFLIFDYATLYRLKHPEIPPADQFTISDSVYSDFIQYLADKNYEYTTNSEKELESLKSAAEKEHYFESIQLFYNKLKDVMLNDKKEDLKTYKDQVKDLLRLEIVSRYYFQKGKVLASLHTDTDIAEAKHILLDPITYAAILNGSYIQPDHAKLIKEDDAKFLEESSDE